MAEEDRGWAKVALLSGIRTGEMQPVKVGDREVAIYNIDGEIYATDNVCTHAYTLLTDGYLEGDVVECPLHGGVFEVKTGKGLGPPIFCDLATYPVRVVGDEVQVKLD
jgi:nitrite reductase/ring-hydroxylating ferredoxin subunit